MKKIYIIRQNPTKVGGAERYLRLFSKELEKNNLLYDVISFKGYKLMPSWFRAICLNIKTSLTKKNKFYFSLDRITKPDVYRAGDGVHKEYIKIKKNKINPLNLLYIYLEKKCFKNAKKIVANSNMIKKQIIKNYHIPHKKIDVVYNGVNKKIYTECLKKNILNKLNVKKKQKIIIFLGNGFERKGLLEFLIIISKLKGDFFAIIIGKDKHVKKYKAKIDKLMLKDKILFLGEVEDPSIYLAISDIFILPTKYDAFSNATLEAMIYKNACFTTAQNGVSEVIQDSRCIMRSPKDFSVTTFIQKLLDDKDELEKIKTKNYQIAKKLTPIKNLNQTIKIIKSIMRNQ